MTLISRATHTLQWTVQWAAKEQSGANPTKTVRSSDCRLQLACMKSELLVNAGQPYCVEYRSRVLYTPPVKSWKSVTPEVGDLTARKELPRVGRMTGTKS